jgi:hypothetical protein
MAVAQAIQVDLLERYGRRAYKHGSPTIGRLKLVYSPATRCAGSRGRGHRCRFLIYLTKMNCVLSWHPALPRSRACATARWFS